MTTPTTTATTATVEAASNTGRFYPDPESLTRRNAALRLAPRLSVSVLRRRTNRRVPHTCSTILEVPKGREPESS
jgi:hypothetical protein